MKKILILGGLGYIGSRLAAYLEYRHKVTIIDIGWFSRKIEGLTLYAVKSTPVFCKDFKTLEVKFIREFDVVINLAGHSSVPFCENDVLGSYYNNVENFIALTRKLGANQKFIYASSGSVYGISGADASNEKDELQATIKNYDKQKQFIDCFIESTNINYYGLRFGTVCGHSTVPRNELMINSMVKSAITNGSVNVSNVDSYRALLGLHDLCRAVEAIIDSDREQPGFYNLASVNSRIGDVGKEIAYIFSTKLEEKESEGSPYSFCLDTTKFRSLFDFRFNDTVERMVWSAVNNDFSVERKWDLKY